MQGYEQILIYEHELMKPNDQKNLLCVIMNKNKQRNIQQDLENANIDKMIINFCQQKKEYIEDNDFDAHHKICRTVSYRYINSFKDARDSSDDK